MTVKQLAEWLLTLPPDIQNGAVTAVVHGSNFTAKRVVAYRTTGDGKYEPDAGIYVEPMGTHISEHVGREIPGYIEDGGEVKTR